MPDHGVGAWMKVLASSRPDAGWQRFLDDYAGTLMQIALEYEGDRQRAEECFLYVCGKLSDDAFARLLKFDPARGVAFRAWLKVVVSNLCVDWYRAEHGRSRPCAAVERLPEFEQSVYQYRFASGMNLEACLRRLRASYPELSRRELIEAVERIHQTLTPRQRWQLTVQREDPLPLRVDGLGPERACGIELVDRNPGPETLAQDHELHEALMQALSTLDPEQRLLLKLRFREDMTLADIARLAGLKDASQARHRIRAALAMLSDQISTGGAESTVQH